jgi:hypothetical protein
MRVAHKKGIRFVIVGESNLTVAAIDLFAEVPPDAGVEHTIEHSCNPLRVGLPLNKR